MSTVSQARTSPAGKYETFVDAQLARARTRIRFLDLAAAGLGFLIVTLGYGLAMVVLDRLLELPSLVRQGAFIVYLVGGLAFLGVTLGRILFRRINPYYAAKQVEQVLQGAKNSVVNYLDLRDQELPAAIRGAVSHRAAKDLARADLDQAISARRAGWLGSVLAGLLFGLFILFFLGPPQFLSLLRRAFAPFQEIGIATRTQITLLQPEGGDHTIGVGRGVSFLAAVDGRVPDPNRSDALRLLFRHQPTDPYTERPLERADGKSEWSAVVPAAEVQNGFWYKIAGGDAETPEYRIQVRANPLVESIEVKYHYRPYLNRPDGTTREANLEAVRGTEVTLTARTNRAVQEGALDVAGASKPLAAERVPEDPKALRFRFVLDKDGSYQIRFTSEDGERNAEQAPYSIRAIPDTAPRVELTKPGQPVELPANGLLKLEGVARDDFGLTALKLRMRGDVVDHTQVYREGKSFRFENGNFPLKLDYKDAVDLSKVKLANGQPLQPGMELEYWLEATDNCDYPEKEAPNVGTSQGFKLKISAPEKDQQKQQQERQQAQQEQKKHNEKQDQKLEQEKKERDEQDKPKPDDKPESQPEDQNAKGQDGQGKQHKNDQPNKDPKGQDQNNQSGKEPNGQQGQNDQPNKDKSDTGKNDASAKTQPNQGQEGQNPKDKDTEEKANKIKDALDQQEKENKPNEKGSEQGNQQNGKSDTQPGQDAGKPDAGKQEGGKSDQGKPNPDGGKQDGGKPDQAKPDQPKPGPDGAKQEGAKPDSGKPDASKQEGGKPDQPKPGQDAGKQEGSKSEGGKPDQPKPGQDAGNKGAQPKPDQPKPGQDAGKPDQAKPDQGAQPKPGQDAGKQEGTKPDQPKPGPDGGKQEGSKPDGGKPGQDAGKPDASKQDGGKPDQAKNDQPKPGQDAGKQDGAKSEGGKPDAGKQDGGKPDGSKSGQDAGKPDQAKPGEGTQPKNDQPKPGSDAGKPDGPKSGQDAGKGEKSNSDKKPSAEELLKALKNGDAKVREDAAKKLEDVKDTVKDPELKRAIEDALKKNGQKPGQANDQAKTKPMPQEGNDGQKSGSEKAPGAQQQPGKENGMGDSKAGPEKSQQGDPKPGSQAGKGADDQGKGEKQSPKGNDGQGTEGKGSDQKPDKPGTSPDGPGGSRRNPATSAPEAPKGTAPDVRFGQKAGALQLEDFKKRVNKDVLQKANMTEAEYREFLKAYEEMLKRKQQTPAGPEEKLLDPKNRGGNLQSIGAKQVKTKGTDDKTEGRGIPLPPREVRDAYKEFTEKLSTLERSPDKK